MQAQEQKDQTGFYEILPEVFFIYITQMEKLRKIPFPTDQEGKQVTGGFQVAEVSMCIFYSCLYQKMLRFDVRFVGYTQKETTSRHFVSCGTSSQ